MQVTTIRTVTTERGCPADADVIWSHHVNRWTWIAMGARSRNVIYTEDGPMVDIYLGAVFRKRRLAIKVNQSDLYDIEIGRVHRRTFERIPEAQMRDIHVEQLDQAIHDLYDANKS